MQCAMKSAITKCVDISAYSCNC